MKITRRQLRQIITEVVKDAAAIGAAGGAGATAAAGIQAGYTAASFAGSAVGAGGTVFVGAVPVAAVLIPAILAITAAAYHGTHAIFDTLEAKKQGTRSFVKNVIKRGLSKSLKRFKKDMSEEEIRKAHRAITQGDDKDIMTGIKMGLLRIDLNDLNDAFEDMKNSASVKYVDEKAVEEILRKIRIAAKK